MNANEAALTVCNRALTSGMEGQSRLARQLADALAESWERERVLRARVKELEADRD